MTVRQTDLVRIRRRCVLSGVLASALGWTATRAQSAYPNKPIKLIIPFPPGGLFDSVGRPLAERLKAHLGTIVVENIGGAASTRGAAVAAKADPDGSTFLLTGNSSQVIAPLASRKLTYDPITDFEPIALIGATGLAFAVHPTLRAETLGDVIAIAKAGTTKLSIGSAGTGSLTHLTGEMLMQRAGLAGIAHVPYTGGGPQLNDLIGGHIPLAVLTLTGQNIELHKSGQIRIVAVTSPKRSAVLPDVPAATETVPGLVSQQFAGLFAPKGTPRSVLGEVQTAVAKAMQDADLQRFFAASAFDVRLDSTPAILHQYVVGEIERWRPVVEASGFKMN